MKYSLRIALVAWLLATIGCSQFGDPQPLTTREKAAGVGTVVGSGVGAGIGSVWGYNVTGGGVGAALGLITGVLIGDHFQELEKRRSELDRRIQESERELQRLCDEVEKLKRELEVVQ
jgi:outer membrane lipoprotein SlyB